MSDETKAPTKSGAARKIAPRRKFTTGFKRKIVAMVARDGWAGLNARYNLPSSSREWPKEFGTAKPPTKSAAARKSNGATPLGPQREAIIFLRQSERAFAEGKAKRGRLLSQLALSTLSGD